MAKQIEAIYENGVLRPLGAVELEEHQLYRLDVIRTDDEALELDEEFIASCASLVSAVHQGQVISGEICTGLAEGRRVVGLDSILQCITRDGQIIGQGPPGVPVDQLEVDGSSLTTSTLASEALPEVSRPPGPSVRGPWTQEFGGQPYRVVATTTPGGVQVRIGRNHKSVLAA